MDINKIPSADILDIIFDGRNKEYGAYTLRKTYNSRLMKALGGTLGICLLCVLGNAFAGSSGKGKPAQMMVKDITIANVEEPIKKQPLPPPTTAQLRPPAATKVEIKKFTDIVVTKDPLPQDVPTQADLDPVGIGTAPQHGVPGGDGAGVEGPKETGIGTELTHEDPPPFTPVQIEARFPGGAAAWKKFLERNLRSDVPVENSAPAGRYSVVVSFVVDKDGNVSDVKAENDPGYGTADEAIRVIKRGPKWDPAIQNGRPVTYRQKQSIIFDVSTEQ